MPKRKRSDEEDEGDYQPSGSDMESDYDDKAFVTEEMEDEEKAEEEVFEEEEEEEEEEEVEEPPAKRRKISKDKEEKIKKKKKKSPKKKKKSTSSKKKTKKETKKKKSSSSSSKKKTSSKSKKEKSVSIRDMGTAKEMVTKILFEKNRPFSVQNMVDNSRNQIKAAMMKKTLAALMKDGIVTEKINKKSKIYQYNQSLLEVLGPEEMTELDEKIKELTEQNKELKSEVKALSHKKSKISNTPTDEELDKELEELSKSIETKQMKVKSIKESQQGGGGGKAKTIMDPKEKEGTIYEYKEYLKYWKERKGKCMDMMSQISEGTGKKMKLLMDEYGLETDEEYDEKISKYRDFLGKM